MHRKLWIPLLLLSFLISSLSQAQAENSIVPEDLPLLRQVIEEYRLAIHDPHYDSTFTDTFVSPAWRSYADDPRSEPAYAITRVNGQTALLIGDRRDPPGMFRRLYVQTGSTVECAAESDGGTFWYLLSDGRCVSGAKPPENEVTASIEWVRFWESRKAIIGAEDIGGLIARNGLGRDSYNLGREKTGQVIVVDEIVDGWAWFRYYATQEGISASSWGYISSFELIFPDTTDPVGTAVLAKNGKTSGKARINIRFRPTTQARKILELPIGTQVDVYGTEDGWTEIEWNRWHGYVKNEYLQ